MAVLRLLHCVSRGTERNDQPPADRLQLFEEVLQHPTHLQVPEHQQGGRKSLFYVLIIKERFFF
jgi:hypothetical protein